MKVNALDFLGRSPIHYYLAKMGKDSITLIIIINKKNIQKKLKRPKQKYYYLNNKKIKNKKRDRENSNIRKNHNFF